VVLTDRSFRMHIKLFFDPQSPNPKSHIEKAPPALKTERDPSVGTDQLLVEDDVEDRSGDRPKYGVFTA
jgi:hypothetical protein